MGSGPANFRSYIYYYDSFFHCCLELIKIFNGGKNTMYPICFQPNGAPNWLDSGWTQTDYDKLDCNIVFDGSIYLESDYQKMLLTLPCLPQHSFPRTN